MRTVTTYSIPIRPVAKPRQTRSDKWRLRDPVVRYRTFCDELRAALPHYQLPGVLYIVFYIPMPKSWSAKKRASMVGAPHEQKPDLDNLCKSFMDAFKTDDSHVYEIHAQKCWAEEGAIELREELANDQYIGRDWGTSKDDFWDEVAA